MSICCKQYDLTIYDSIVYGSVRIYNVCNNFSEVSINKISVKLVYVSHKVHCLTDHLNLDLYHYTGRHIY